MRDRERRERRDEKRRSRKKDRDGESRGDFKVHSELSEASTIARIAEGDDYDAMLKCLKNAIAEIRKVRKDYFAGKLTDRETKEKMEEIEKKYEPVAKSLQQAQDNGDLNYNQHKKQMKLMGEVMKEYEATINTLMKDLEDSFR